MSSDRLSVGKRLIVGKKAAPESQDNNQPTLAQVGANGGERVVNTYYRVRKGDTLGDIAQKHSINLAQLRSWNDLKTSRINIGDQLIVKQELVDEPAVEQEESDEEVIAPEVLEENILPVESETGSNIISDYLKEQMNKSAESRLDDIIDGDSINIKIS